MKYLRLWYYKRNDVKEYKKVSFCGWKEYGHNNHHERNARKWFEFFMNNMPSGTTERLYILLRNVYGKDFRRSDFES